MIEFTATWRFTVTVLAIACLGNGSVVFTAPEQTGAVRVIGILSAACSVALIASLRYSIRRVTLLWASLAMWLHVYEAVTSPIPGWSAFRLSAVFFAFGLLAFGAWLHVMQGAWPRASRAWRLVLI